MVFAMSNYGAVQQIDLSYTGLGGTPVVPPTETTNSPYQALSEGFIDVPDATVGSTTYSVPFGGIAVDATYGYIKNMTGQNLDVNVNGGGVTDSIPDGGIRIWAHPGVTSTPILSYALTTTGVQSGAGRIEYRLMGDPT